jgi:hypothetical protein
VDDKEKLASQKQVGGQHYKDLKESPLRFILANGISYCLGNSIKYISRSKGDRADRIKDLLKAKHYIDLELEIIYKVDSDGKPLIG